MLGNVITCLSNDYYKLADSTQWTWKKVEISSRQAGGLGWKTTVGAALKGLQKKS